jgi:hypothetical protein
VAGLISFPGFLMFAMARGGYLRQGCDRKARELWRWFAAGLVFWFVTIVIVVSLLSGGR